MGRGQGGHATPRRPPPTWCSAARPAAYAICRPPGHHAGPAFFGGSCYLNNAAVAAARLRRGGVDRVAIVDIDAHHGNGTQACWWDDPAVLYASLHVDPGAGWFPHTVGYADEVDATRTNCNLPLAPGTADAGWLAALEQLATVVERFGPDAVVVSLGVDAAVEDPNSPLEVTQERLRAPLVACSGSSPARPCWCTRAATCSRRWPATRSRCSRASRPRRAR